MDNPLAGLPLRYLIGKDSQDIGRESFVTEVGYDADQKPEHGLAIKYCNLFDEKNSGDYGPYLPATDTSSQYDEGVIDPKGEGWHKNLHDQGLRAKAQGFEYVELDNPDAYDIHAILDAVTYMAAMDLKVIAKNAQLIEGRGTTRIYLAHSAIYGCIVERDAGTPHAMHGFRVAANKPDLPIWFVAFGHGRRWAQEMASQAKHYTNMGVTYCTAGEYKNAAVDLLLPQDTI